MTLDDLELHALNLVVIERIERHDGRAMKPVDDSVDDPAMTRLAENVDG